MARERLGARKDKCKRGHDMSETAYFRHDRNTRQCGACTTENSARLYRELREKCHSFLGGKCVKCGSTERLEIDHVQRATKSFEPLTHYSKKEWWEIERELVKCQLLCRAHHEEKTASETSVNTHGALCMYQKGCRCAECRRTHAEDTARRRGVNKKRLENGEIEVKHGTMNAYKNYMCRCEPCRLSASIKKPKLITEVST